MKMTVKFPCILMGHRIESDTPAFTSFAVEGDRGRAFALDDLGRTGVSARPGAPVSFGRGGRQSKGIARLAAASGLRSSRNGRTPRFDVDFLARQLRERATALLVRFDILLDHIEES